MQCIIRCAGCNSGTNFLFYLKGSEPNIRRPSLRVCGHHYQSSRLYLFLLALLHMNGLISHACSLLVNALNHTHWTEHQYKGRYGFNHKQKLEQVTNYSNLGRTLTDDGRCEMEIKKGIEMAKHIFDTT